MFRRKYLFPIILVFIFSGPISVYAAPKADIWDHWLPHDPSSTRRVDHTPWHSFLKKYILSSKDGINRIAYGKVSAADRQAIDISPGFFADGPWGKKLIKIEGEEVSLNEIEHRILRPIWQDTRIHYVVNCASLGCPNLQDQAFTAENADKLLDQGAREYVNHKRGVLIENNKLKVSSIYKWFIADFGGNDAGVIEHLKLYALPELRNRLEGLNHISGHDYDWALNDATP